MFLLARFVVFLFVGVVVGFDCSCEVAVAGADDDRLAGLEVED
jgi:hypothetical protein